MSVTEQEITRALEDLRAQVRGANVVSPVTLTPLQRAVSDANANWFISTRLPPPDARAPFSWRIVYLAKSLVRRVMAQVFNTFVEQQNTFNANVARALTELAKENAQLRAQVHTLETQIRNQKS